MLIIKGAKKNHREQSRKGGGNYEKHLKYDHTGLQGERNRIRSRDRYKWLPYKRIIAPESQLHHSWYADSAECEGLALVEADQHMHGIVNVVEILKGEITLFTEKGVRER